MSRPPHPYPTFHEVSFGRVPRSATGRLRRAPTSRVTGEQVEIGPRSLPAGAWGRPGLSHLWWSWWMGSAVALISTVIRVAIVSLLTALVVLLAREHVGFLGLGSIGRAALELMLDRMPHPRALMLCDVAAKADEQIEAKLN